MKDQGERATGPAFEPMHRFILWLIPIVEKFTRSQKLLRFSESPLPIR